MRIFAVTETDAHLRLLASRGLVGTDGGAVPVDVTAAECRRPRPRPTRAAPHTAWGWVEALRMKDEVEEE